MAMEHKQRMVLEWPLPKRTWRTPVTIRNYVDTCPSGVEERARKGSVNLRKFTHRRQLLYPESRQFPIVYPLVARNAPEEVQHFLCSTPLQ